MPLSSLLSLFAAVSVTIPSVFVIVKYDAPLAVAYIEQRGKTNRALIPERGRLARARLAGRSHAHADANSTSTPQNAKGIGRVATSERRQLPRRKSKPEVHSPRL